MKKRYRISDINIEVSIPDELMYDDDRALADFRIYDEPCEDLHKFQFQLVEQLTPPAGEEIAKFPGYRVYQDQDAQIRYIGSVDNDVENAYIRAQHRGYDHQVQLKASEYTDKIGAKTVLTAMAAEHLILHENGVILHASFIAHQGKAILFTAPSGTGKSTQADLWNQHRDAEIINGDRAVIRIIDGKAYASGIPFAGSSTYCKNRTLPLQAIVYLGQAPETTITKLNTLTAFRKVWEECTVNTWNPTDVEKATSLVIDILGQVPVYYLPCTPDQSAIVALENLLRKL